MANCAYCNSYILFGGPADETGRYCNEDCRGSGHLALISRQIPEETLQRLTDDIHQGSCPRCKGRGPVDVHKAHRVWSALLLTSWSSSPAVSCRSCATKRQLGALLFSGTLGWWGFPWGLVMTPFQIVRNIIEMCSGHSPYRPSPLLQKFVAMQAAAHLVDSGSMNRAASTVAPANPPPLPGDDSRFQPR
jgi:hypothetical protein